MIVGLRYKLRMMRVPFDVPKNIFCNNEKNVKSSVNLDTSLKKKQVFITFHWCRETFAAGIISVFFPKAD